MKRVTVFAVAGWAGFFGMSLELLSGRILAPNFGSSIQVWGSVIAVFLVALSVGYLAGGRLSLRTQSLAPLAFLLLAAAAATLPAALLSETILDRVFAMVMEPHYGSLASAALLFFLPTMVAGMISPYAVRLLVGEPTRVGHSAGLLFFVSTVGSAAGTLVTSFYLVLVLDTHQIFWGFIGVSVALGTVTLLLSLLSSNGTSLEQES